MIIAMLVVAGLALGSFVNAFVWRLHEQTEIKEKSANKGIAKKELSILNGRSMCPHCRHQLAGKDLVPVVSWLTLRGKCRYCGKPISWQYPAVELLLAVLYIISYIYWPWQLTGANVAIFVLWLAILVLFVSLTVYDARWHVLPDVLVYSLAALAAMSLIVSMFARHDAGNLALGALWGVLIISGSFYVLYQLSAGKWIGGGDVKLGLPLGLLVGGPLAGVLVLLLASVGGTLYSLPQIIQGKAGRSTRVPFGPFLILAAFLTVLFGSSIIAWYKGLLNA